MKIQRKIITERPQITDNEILKYRQPFKKILKEFYEGSHVSGSMSSLSLWTITGLSILIISAIIFFNVNKNIPKPDDTVATAEIYDTIANSSGKASRKINPPFSDYNIAFEIFKITNNKKSKRLKTKNGTEIIIPKNAFVDSSGNKVTSNITIKYRDFYNPSDFFLSGIPMDYDSAGNNYTFSSAGMFEINALAGNRQLYLKKGKKIKLNFASNMKNIYNVYYYDTIENRWTFSYREPDSSVKKRNMKKADYTFGFKDSDSAKLEEKDFMKIIGLVNKKHLKVGKIDNYAFPAPKEMLKGTEFEDVDSMMLEIAKGEKFDKKYYSVLWDKVYLTGDAGNLKINLLKSGKVHTFRVVPVIDKKRYYDAKAKYKIKLKRAKQRERELAKYEKVLDKVDKAIDKWLFTRAISISKLGIFNCDIPISMPEYAMEGKADIRDANGNKLYYDYIFVTQSGKNVLWKYSNRWFYSNPAKLKNIGWLVTRDKKLAVIPPENFEKKSKGAIIAQVYESGDGIGVLMKLLN